MSHFWKLLFVPHEHNNHRARLIQPSFIALFIAIYLLNQSIIKSLTIAKPGILGYSSEITAQKVYNQTNQMRQNAGLPLLHYNPVLSASATAKARDMFANNYWAHKSPSGKTPWYFFKANGYQYSVAGENLAKDFYDTDTVIKAWMNSTTHRANIVNVKYQEVGIGVVDGVLNGVKTTLVVQHFGAPLGGRTSTKSTEKVAVQNNHRVLADTVEVNSSSKVLISPLQISQAIGAMMFIVIIGVLLVDAYFTLKNKTHRLSSHSLAHVGFLFIILVSLLVYRSGGIV